MTSLATVVVILIVMMYFFLIYIFTVNFADSESVGRGGKKTMPNKTRSVERAVRYKRRYSDSNYDVYDIAEGSAAAGNEDSDDEDCVYFLFPEATGGACEPRPTLTRRRTTRKSR
ncbi:hypothetical protein LSAT2_006638 [Lamellibrachia satsuma]|nr:hypothetical protein LSAT2_006638 [Lamellibrachia satsuma]